MKGIFILLALCANAAYGQIVWQSDFSTGDKTQGRIISLVQTGYGQRGYSIVPPDSAGKWAARFEVYKTDTLIAKGKRQELYFPPYLPFMQQVEWYGVEITQPVWQGADNRPEGNFQIIDSGNATVLINLVHIGNKYQLFQHYRPSADTTYSRIWEVCDDTPGVANYFVLHYVPAIDNTGKIELWRNGRKIFFKNCRDEFWHPVNTPDTYVITGPNASAANKDGMLYMIGKRYFKCGMYKWPYKTTNPGVYPKRAVFISKIKLGGPASTIADFK